MPLVGAFVTRIAFVALPTLATACSANPAPAPLSRPTLPAVPADAVAATPPAGIAPFYVGPADFKGSTVTIDLPAPPSGRSLVFVVADLGVGAFRRGRDLVREDVPVRFDVEPSAAVRSATVGHALPPRRPALLLAPDSNAVLPAAELSPKKAFKFYADDTKGYVDATGRLAYVGTRYAFYEDPKNQRNFTEQDYARIDAKAGEDYGALVDVFGPSPDVDGNGRVIVFVSRTVTERFKGGQGFVDPCNLNASALVCGGTGDIIYVWSLDGFTDTDRLRDHYVEDYYPRLLLHETIHLCQHRAAVNRPVPRLDFTTPAYLLEGQAMLMRYIRPHGGVDWGELSQLVDHLGPHETPFETPYAMGSLFGWWMHQHYGPSVERALMDAEVDPAVVDPVEKATGAPEPLVFAQFYAALRLDGTAYGHETGLEFGVEHVRSHIPYVPVEPVHVGETKDATVLATGRAAFEVEHQEPVRIKVETFLEKAFVLVVQPR
jgi:hypothetical protein